MAHQGIQTTRHSQKRQRQNAAQPRHQQVTPQDSRHRTGVRHASESRAALRRNPPADVTLQDVLALPLSLSPDIKHTLYLSTPYTKNLTKIGVDLIAAGLPVRPVQPNDQAAIYVEDCLQNWSKQCRGNVYTSSFNPHKNLPRDGDYDHTNYHEENDPVLEDDDAIIFSIDINGCNTFSMSRMRQALDAYPGNAQFKLGHLLHLALESISDNTLPIGGPRHVLYLTEHMYMYDEDTQYDDLHERISYEWASRMNVTTGPQFDDEVLATYIEYHDITTFRRLCHRLQMPYQGCPAITLQDLQNALEQARKFRLPKRHYDYARKILAEMQAIAELDQEIKAIKDRTPFTTQLQSYTTTSVNLPTWIADISSTEEMQKRLGYLQEQINEIEQLSMEYGEACPPLLILHVTPQSAADVLRCLPIFQSIENRILALMDDLEAWPR